MSSASVIRRAPSGPAFQGIDDGDTAVWSSELGRWVAEAPLEYIAETHFLEEGTLLAQPWIGQVIASGTITTLSEAGHPGIWRLTAAAAASSGARVITAAAIILGATDYWQIRTIWRTPPVFSIGGVATVQNFGLLNIITPAIVSNGVLFVQDDGTGNIHARNVRSSLNETVLLAALEPSTWYEGTIEINMARPESIFKLFDSDGALLSEARLTTFFPTTALRCGFVAGTVGASAGGVAADVDLMWAGYRRRAQ